MEANELAWHIFITHLISQARVGGMGGFIGFDYGTLAVIFDAYDIGRDERWIYLEKFSEIGRLGAEYWKPKENDKPQR